MRIIAGQWRGRRLLAPAGAATRPTADRVRQALFDMLLHAPWGGRAILDGAAVLDALAGTGALGLEALSRGASRARFLENDRAALATLRANVAALLGEAAPKGGSTVGGASGDGRAGAGVAGVEARVMPADATRPTRADLACGLVFLDPPYGAGLPEKALPALCRTGWIAPGAVAVVEVGRDEPAPALPGWEPLAERAHGAARVLVLREVDAVAGGGGPSEAR